MNMENLVSNKYINHLFNSGFTIDDIRLSLKKYYYNRKENDKYSIAYVISMIDNTMIPSYCDVYKRDELLCRLFGLLSSDNNVYKVVQSEYTTNKIIKYIK